MNNESDSSDSIDMIEKFYKEGMNLGALSANIHYMSEPQVSSLFGDEWKKVPCGDGTHALVLKKPLDAFKMYAKEWETSFRALADVVGQLKAEAEGEVKNKIIALFNGLNNVDNTIRQAYLNAYITFASKPCSDKNQEYKMKMDDKINTAAFTITSFRMVIDIYKEEIKNGQKADFILQEFTNLTREMARILSS
jgi:hypothetical protein